ncbi:relA-associated inhibitor [Amia ocellicauda]|uniref:relA-associated inhibitor n=1 Tax=Amia ocellicauda TaxID=2972642 RepID=UPI0034638CC4
MNPVPTMDSSMFLQSLSSELDASLATADELSREFNSLFQQASPISQPTGQTWASSTNASTTSGSVYSSGSASSWQSNPATSQTFSSLPSSNGDRGKGGSGSSSSSSYETGSQSLPYISSSDGGGGGGGGGGNSLRSQDKYAPITPSHLYSPHQLTPPQARRERISPSLTPTADSTYSYGQLTSPNQSPRSQRRPFAPSSPSPHLSQGSDFDQSLRLKLQNPSSSLKSAVQSGHGSPELERMFSPRPMRNEVDSTFDYSSLPIRRHAPTPSKAAQYEVSQLWHGGGGTLDRNPFPRPIGSNQTASNTLPRNFGFRSADDTMKRPKIPVQWNESNLDVSYERRPQHSYDKSEWHRPSVAPANWRESNLDSPTPARSKEVQSRVLHTLPSSSHSIPRNTHISLVPSPSPSLSSSPYPPISRISIPPSTPWKPLRRPIPLSVIMRLQGPSWAAANTVYPHAPQLSWNNPPHPPLLQDNRPPPSPEQQPPELSTEVLSQGDKVEAESVRDGEGEAVEAVPRPLSPTRLQPVLVPISEELPDRQELLRIRSEIPRALKKRGSVDQSGPPQKMPLVYPEQYKQIISKLFRRNKTPKKEAPGRDGKLEPSCDSNSSSESEDIPQQAPTYAPAAQTLLPGQSPTAQLAQEGKAMRSILKRSGGRSGSSPERKARLSPLVLLLDGALVGELDTVQRAVQEMSDPSQPNDEGITALHNAICGGHYPVVEFLVRIGANTSAPDSHNWTPLHCAASCNDRTLCEFLVRSGAAVLAVTQSDGATAAQKCDPFAQGFEECESFLRGAEEAMGVENSGVVYALWGYSAQAPDELSFKEGDMVTILHKVEGEGWWWASLCGREGYVPNNYFGLFPKVRPKSLC